MANQYEEHYPTRIPPSDVKEAAEVYSHGTSMAEAAEEAGLSEKEFKAVRKVHRLRKSDNTVAGIEYALPSDRAEMARSSSGLHSGFTVEGESISREPNFQSAEPADYDDDLEAPKNPRIRREIEEAREVGGEDGKEMERLLRRLAARQEQGEIPDDLGQYDERTWGDVIEYHEATGDVQAGLAVGTIEDGRRVEQVQRLDGKAIVTSDLPEDGVVAYLTENKPPLFVPEAADEWMRKAYSNWDGYKMKGKDIAEAVGMTQLEFRRYRSRRGWTRDMNPLSPAKMVTRSVDQLEEDLASMKSVAVRKRLEKKQRREAEKKAEKWDNLEASLVDSVRDAIGGIPEVQLGHTPEFKVEEDKAQYNLLLPLNDWQIGSYAAGEKMRFGEEFSLEIAERMVDDYIRQLGNYLKRNSGATFGTPIVCLLGDILHGLSGETMHGTKLAKHMREYDWEQMREGVRLINKVADFVMSQFGDMKIITLPGNHAGAASQVLGEMIYQRWRSSISEGGYVAPANRTHFEMIGNSLFCFDHGAGYDSGVRSGKINRSGPKRDLQIKDLVYTRADLVSEARSRGGGVYFVMGDQHHTIDESGTSIEVIKLPALPSGDAYADEHGWHSRPSQGAMLVDRESGLKHLERFYFDSPEMYA